MKYGLVGASGKLGKEVITVFTDNNHELVFSFDIQGEWKQSDPEIIIDCSLPEAFTKMLTFVNNFNVPLIVATTGLSDSNISAPRTRLLVFSAYTSFVSSSSSQ